MNRFFHGSSILLGNNTIPGVELTPELKKYAPIILQACRDWGLDFYPTVLQLLTYDEISEIAAYGGFPVRYPHWSFGMEYEELQRGYEFGTFKIYEMVVNCCDPETPVLTSRGTISAREVVLGDKVIVGNETRDVVAVKTQQASRTLKIKLHKGQSLVCTPNHKWRVLGENGLVWKEANQLNKDDLLVGTENVFKNCPAELPWAKNDVVQGTLPSIRRCLKDIYPPKKMTIKLAELLGILTGDGSVGVKRAENIVSVAVGKKEKYYTEHVRKLMMDVFGVSNVFIYEKPHAYTVCLCSKFAVDFLDKIGFKKGSTYETKRIPRSIWQSSNEYRAAYLKGLFDTDGYAVDVLGFSCFNKDLADDAQIMLTEMGIQTVLEHTSNGVGKNGDQKFINKVHVIGNPSLRKFQDKIGFSQPHKVKGLDVLVNKTYCRGGGVFVPYLQKQLVKWASKQKITTYSSDSLGRSKKVMELGPVGLNALNSFIQRAENENFFIPNELRAIAENPIFAVEFVEESGSTETVDIALNHEAHDFVAKGLISHNTNPCYQWLLSSNSLADNLTVIAHATGHNDFFKNNIHFSATDTNMLNKMANHGTRIRKYMARWGKERVTEFLDHVMRLETLIDGADAWTDRVIKDKTIHDSRTYRQPRRINVSRERNYMEPFINTKEFCDRENERVAKEDIAEEIGILREPTRNILGFLRDHAPLKPWQADIISMIYDEAIYFFPQRQTKTENEGWASLTDSVIMAEQGHISLGQPGPDHCIIEYAEHKMGVLGGKYSMNPYKLGFYLFKDIRERWDKGRFGTEWDNCKDMRKKENWDLGTNLGKEKIFEVRKYYDDLTFIHEFFTEDFCREQEYFHWKHYPSGDFKIENRDFKEIKKQLMQRHVNGGLPDIRLTEPNYRGKGALMLQHYHDGRPIHEPYVADVMASIRYIWGNDLFLATKNNSGEEKVYCCYGTNSERDVEVQGRKKFLKEGDR